MPSADYGGGGPPALDAGSMKGLTMPMSVRLRSAVPFLLAIAASLYLYRLTLEFPPPPGTGRIGSAQRIASFNMHRDDVDLFMRQPWVLTASVGAAIVQAAQKRQRKFVSDYEHATRRAKETAQPAPAAADGGCERPRVAAGQARLCVSHPTGARSHDDRTPGRRAR